MVVVTTLMSYAIQLRIASPPVSFPTRVVVRKAFYRFVGACEESIWWACFCFLGGRVQMVVVITLMHTHKKLSIDFLVLVSEACG